MTDTIPMTVAGEAMLKKELDELVKVKRPEVVASIAEARAHGDLKENAEYHAAKEQQSFIEGRILELKHKLSHATIIDISTINNDGKVIFGAKIKLLNLDDEKEVSYQLVGDDEADLSLGKVSIKSPIARALVGKFEGDEVEVITPGGEVAYEIIAVDYV